MISHQANAATPATECVEKPRRALVIVSKMDAGGAETVMMKYYRALDRSKYQLDFCVSDSAPGFYDEEILRLGGRLIRVAKKSSRPLKAMFDIVRVVKNGHYCCVIRNAENAMASLDLLAARLAGQKNTVFRSTNSSTSTGGILGRLAHLVGQHLLKHVTSFMVAPSSNAAKFMFGEFPKEGTRIALLPNAIDYNDYCFDLNLRREGRQKLGIRESALLIASVGRLVEQKNQQFAIKVLSCLLSQNKDAYLLIVGKGPLRNELEGFAKKNGVDDRVFFLPPVKEIKELYSALDVLLMPSRFEGMPNTAIEAQASGLRCILSDAITREAAYSEGTVFLGTNDDDVDLWADQCIAVDYMNRRKRGESLLGSEFDMSCAISRFIRIVYQR